MKLMASLAPVRAEIEAGFVAKADQHVLVELLWPLCICYFISLKLIIIIIIIGFIVSKLALKESQAS